MDSGVDECAAQHVHEHDAGGNRVTDAEHNRGPRREYQDDAGHHDSPWRLGGARQEHDEHQDRDEQLSRDRAARGRLLEPRRESAIEGVRFLNGGR